MAAMWKISSTAIGLAAVLAASGSASAHHSVAMFDFTKQGTVTGVVESFEYANPHSWIKIRIAGTNDKIEAWGLEGMSPNMLSRMGWTRNTLKPGDKVSVAIHPMRDPKLKGGFAVSITFPDGKVMNEFPAPAPAQE